MQTIHAPWRIDYILAPKGKGCFLCVKRTRGFQRRHPEADEAYRAKLNLTKCARSCKQSGAWRERMAKDIDRYTYRVTWSEEDQEHVGLCAEFPSLSWLEKNPEKALAGIR